MQNKGYYAVQGHSTSPMSVPIERPYATSYYSSIWHRIPILYRFALIADYCLNFGHFAFWAPIYWWLRVHLRFIEKLVADFLFVLIELFSLDVTAEALRTDIDWKSTFLNVVGRPREAFLHW